MPLRPFPRGLTTEASSYRLLARAVCFGEVPIFSGVVSRFIVKYKRSSYILDTHPLPEI